MKSDSHCKNNEVFFIKSFILNILVSIFTTIHVKINIKENVNFRREAQGG